MTDERAIAIADCQRIDFAHEWQDNYPALLRKARRLSAGGGHDPEDLLSQATLKVLNYLNLEREVENFVGLMLVSLLQVYQDSNRRHSNRVFARSEEFIEQDGLFSLPLAPDAERSYIAKETLGDIFDYLATLPRGLQEVFRLRFLNDLSYQEISRRLDITEVSARQKVKKLRCRLQAWIEE